ncbi:MAG: tetrathionate reductase family octaheme c-type cytochrome [Bacteroidales bacterium]|nr:tetrathionate reductase family octaheme c-type cytochrome [Bacteroidales bacterium]
MKKIFIYLLVINIIIIALVVILTKNQTRETVLQGLQKEYSVRETSSVDHSKFEILQKPFANPQDATAACLTCHTGRGEEMLKSAHFLWSREEYVEGRGITNVGKKNLLNNFCIGIGTNEASCNRCHAGYGWNHKSYDFTDQKNIDCLVCHDNSGKYTKKNGGAGMPDDSVDLNKVAQNVGKPMKTNCGSCHFYGGGGNNVKHGDLEDALLTSGTDVDVHMGYDGLNMECIDCHPAEKHVMKGKLYAVSSMNRNRALCTDCHTSMPHKETIINEHSLKVACQTCHIPTYAKVNATKMYWDWSTAGKLKDGKPYHEEDSMGNHSYLSIKGDFVWGKNVEPEYVWFNGTANHYLVGDTISDTTQVVKMNQLYGSYEDRDAQIIPVKIHRGKQVYDKKNKVLIQPNLSDSVEGNGAFWTDFNWQKASQKGMEYIDQKYSGDYGFVHTEMYWPINYMVSKKESAVSCIECHSRDGRLKNVSGFYMPGRDFNTFVDKFGLIIIILTLAGVLGHGLLRILSAHKRKK